ncbi:peptidoglycan/LPS O-acetylase OafA/YrhL [Methylopila capsulata]|uniref:Acyltransferase n=1 Tax=Methylopila capsulata TaxID=61654 RepID=A0A9W6MRJ3_9HYPH|nr:acyltransferase [Methylopila capsulata]MBM7850486.1 peptidoglycan/LPS O-acetylase OafA/YrhL [Methylopila capsulata]GLK55780.1 acyltransferase [Methylopila capsulata]
MPTLADCLARRDNTLAAVRMLGASAVLWAHAWVVTTPGIATRDYAHVFAFSLDFHGVHAFFTLSGLLLARSYLTRPDLLRFVVARLVRYVPAILISALIAAFVLGPIVTRLSLADYFGAAAPVLFVLKVATLLDVNATLPGVFDGNANPSLLYIPLWTVHYEFVFAVALGVVGALGLLQRKLLVLAGLGLTVAVNVVWFWNGEAAHLALGSPHHLVRFGSSFGIGVAMAVFADRIPVSNRVLLGVAAVCAPLAFTPLAAIAGMVLIAYAILCIGFTPFPLARPLAALGVWSYGFYVWGYLIEQTLAYAAPQLDGWPVFLIVLPLALAAGWLSWRFVERPSLGWTGPITAQLRRLAPGGRADRRVAPPPARPPSGDGWVNPRPAPTKER